MLPGALGATLHAQSSLSKKQTASMLPICKSRAARLILCPLSVNVAVSPLTPIALGYSFPS